MTILSRSYSCVCHLLWLTLFFRDIQLSWLIKLSVSYMTSEGEYWPQVFSIIYALKNLFEKVLWPSQLQIFCIGVDNLISECRNKSDRSYLQATFKMGISHTAKMKDTKEFAAIFYTALYIHTKKMKMFWIAQTRGNGLNCFKISCSIVIGLCRIHISIQTYYQNKPK